MMAVRSKKYGRNQDFDGNKILNSSLNDDDIQFIFFDVVENEIYELKTKARFPFTIVSIALKTSIASAVVAVKINGTAVTGLSGLVASGTLADHSATALNTVVVGDIVTLVIGAVSGAISQTSGNVLIKRT